jgi:hypothetical protein
MPVIIGKMYHGGIASSFNILKVPGILRYSFLHPFLYNSVKLICYAGNLFTGCVFKGVSSDIYSISITKFKIPGLSPLTLLLILLNKLIYGCFEMALESTLVIVIIPDKLASLMAGKIKRFQVSSL